MIENILSAILQGVARLVFIVFGFFLDIIFALFGDFNIPEFDILSPYLMSFWDLCFNFVGWFRSAFCIDNFSFNLIISILVIKLTYKPAVSLVKMFIGWYSKLKG